MSYKNSFKLLTTNFHLVWKQLCYTLISFIVVGLLGYLFSIPTINILKENGVIKEFANIFETIYTSPKEVVTTISNTFLHLAEVISKNFTKIWFSVIATIFIVLFVHQVLKNLAFYNLASVMSYQMTCFVEIGYTRNLISNFSSGIKYSLVKTIYDLPFSIFKTATIFLYFHIAVYPILIFIGLFIVSLILILISTPISITTAINITPNASKKFACILYFIFLSLFLFFLILHKMFSLAFLLTKNYLNGYMILAMQLSVNKRLKFSI